MGDELILLVEDNPDDVTLTLRAFEKNDIRNKVVVVHDGQEALDYLFCSGRHAGRDGAILPNLILLDLKLPRVGGLEVLKRMRNEAPTQLIPVVVLTSSDEERDVAESYRLGANSYVRKPVAFNEFIDVVKQLGCYWLRTNLSPPPS